MASIVENVRTRALFLSGEWIETGEWDNVRSPYSGEIVGRVARGGADETPRAIDAAARALRSHLPAHERAALTDRHAADRALPRGSRCGGVPAGGLAEHRVRPRLRDRRRARRGRAGEGAHLHRLRAGRLVAARARAAQEGPARARELDAHDRRIRR